MVRETDFAAEIDIPVEDYSVATIEYAEGLLTRALDDAGCPEQPRRSTRERTTVEAEGCEVACWTHGLYYLPA